MNVPSLSPVEARVLAVLVEKQRSVPDTYPMSLNALVAGCNQKTSRSPIMSASEAEVLEGLDALKHRSLVVETSGGRVMRYAHNTQRVLAVPSEAVALLATLMLRGPQTPGELRIHSERLHRFADTSSVEAYLNELASRADGALVVELARQPGARETRWMHTLSGMPVADVVAVTAAPEGGVIAASEVAALRADVDRLRDEIAALKNVVAKLCAELGVARS